MSSNKNFKKREIYESSIDLTSYLENLNISTPVFGYPLLNYAESRKKILLKTPPPSDSKKMGEISYHHFSFHNQSETVPDEVPKHKNMWNLLARPITNKYASRVPIGEILDKYNRIELNFKEVLNCFTHGRSIKFEDIKNKVKQRFQVEKKVLKQKILKEPVEQPKKLKRTKFRSCRSETLHIDCRTPSFRIKSYRQSPKSQSSRFCMGKIQSTYAKNGQKILINNEARMHSNPIQKIPVNFEIPVKESNFQKTQKSFEITLKQSPKTKQINVQRDSMASSRLNDKNQHRSDCKFLKITYSS